MVICLLYFTLMFFLWIFCDDLLLTCTCSFLPHVLPHLSRDPMEFCWTSLPPKVVAVSDSFKSLTSRVQLQLKPHETKEKHLKSISIYIYIYEFGNLVTTFHECCDSWLWTCNFSLGGHLQRSQQGALNVDVHEAQRFWSALGDAIYQL